MEKKIYFDNGSTSWPKAPGVAESVSDLLVNGAFNINRGNYEGAYEVAGRVLDTREKLARMFQVEDSRRVIFTPGVTCSLNYFIKGFLKEGDHVLVTGLEHNAVMRPLHQMRTKGVSYDVIPVDRQGNLNTEAAEALVRPNTKAVIASHASNVCGTVVPIEELGEFCGRRHLFFVVDTAQTAGTLKIDMPGSKIDLLAFAGHKGLLGPQGIGGFLISEELDREMEPLLAGGTGSQSDSLEMPDQLPDKYESGTMNLPGIIGLHAALSYLEETGIDVLRKKKMELTGYFLEQAAQLEGIRIVGRPDTEKRVAVVSLDFQTVDNAVAAFELERRAGIMTRVGLHCSPLAHQSLGTFPQGTVRFAFSACNTREEIDVCIAVLKELLSEVG
nr:aminotransferase class V-fold PLP-dependent enzyme [uncultured Merdimonas sp.]